MIRLVPFTSDVFCDVVGTEAMRAAWSDESLIGHWRAVEGAVVEVQAEMGWIPSDAAREIVAKLETFPLQAVVDRRRETGHLMVAFLKAFRAHCGPAAEHMHVGPTTQDILDTGLVRMIDASHGIIIELIQSLEEALCARALEHADTPVMGRSHAQHAVPTTFGFLLAGWAQEARDHLVRLRESEKRWRVVSLTAAVGSRNAFVELSDVTSARELERRVGEKLGLPVATIDWHARGDKLAEPVVGLASLTSSLAKWALNLRSWQSAEIAETTVPYRAEEYSSSTMPPPRPARPAPLPPPPPPATHPNPSRPGAAPPAPPTPPPPTPPPPDPGSQPPRDRTAPPTDRTPPLTPPRRPLVFSPTPGPTLRLRRKSPRTTRPET